jgi:zinc/manganese transport system substrate-binding protein
MRSLAIGLTTAVLLVASTLPAVTQDQPVPSVVVTTEVLGSVVADLVGDAGVVHTLMPGGADPHAWQPSARDSEAIFEADLVIANGLDLEEGLISVLEQAAVDGVPIFHATDHVAVREGVGAADGEHATTAAEHDHATGDPHFWLDPLAMRDVVLALEPALAAVGIESGERGQRLAAELEALHTELAAALSSIPDDRRQLVSGHGALGYLADRFGLRIVGTVVPGLSSADEPSAREIAELVETIRDAGATALFTDIGTPRAVAEAVASETGARLIELQVAQLPEGGSYADLLRGLVTAVANALTG